VLSREGITPDPEKVQAVADWPRPQNLTEVRAFVALASYYRRHIRSFAEIVRPLHELTKKDVSFYWGTKQEQSFIRLKEALVSAPVLAMPIDGGGYVLDADACNYSMGCMLQQWQNGELKVIGYASRAFSDTELRYCTTRRELAAIIFALKYYRHFLLGYEFVLRTDHAALTYLMKTPNPVGQSARYLETIAEYNFSVQYRPGDSHRNADALSRRPCGRDRKAPPFRQCGPMLDPVDEKPELQEMADESEIQGDESGTNGLPLGLDSIKEDSVLEPSLAKITLRIPELDSGTSDEEAKTGAEAEVKCTKLQACKTRKAAAADFWMEMRNPEWISICLRSAQKWKEINL